MTMRWWVTVAVGLLLGPTPTRTASMGVFRPNQHELAAPHWSGWVPEEEAVYHRPSSLFEFVARPPRPPRRLSPPGLTRLYAFVQAARVFHPDDDSLRHAENVEMEEPEENIPVPTIPSDARVSVVDATDNPLQREPDTKQLQRILATMDASELAKYLPPGMVLVTVPSPTTNPPEDYYDVDVDGDGQNTETVAGPVTTFSTSENPSSITTTPATTTMQTTTTASSTTTTTTTTTTSTSSTSTTATLTSTSATTPVLNPSTTAKQRRGRKLAVCGTECRLAASLRIVSGADWSPALWDNTSAYHKHLTTELKTQLEEVFRRSSLEHWFDHVEVEAFSTARHLDPDTSVIVDVVLWLRDLDLRPVDPDHVSQLLLAATSATAGTAATCCQLGPYTLDPSYADFIVLRDEAQESRSEATEENRPSMPQWAVAVIVLTVSASLMLALAFGITTAQRRWRERGRRQLDDRRQQQLQQQREASVAALMRYDSSLFWQTNMEKRQVPYAASLGGGRIPKASLRISRQRENWSRAASPASTTAAHRPLRRPPDYDMHF